MEKKQDDGLNRADALAALTARLIPVGVTAEDLGLLRAPEPECLGRPDSACREQRTEPQDEHDHSFHDHDHDHDHSHDAHVHHHPHAQKTAAPAGRPHAQDEQASVPHEHDHTHGHGDDTNGHGDEGHEHMRVFPVFNLDANGQIVENVNAEGRLSDAVRANLVRQGKEAGDSTDEAGESSDPGAKPQRVRHTRKA